MDVAQAHKELGEGQHSLKYFFMPNEELDVICELLEQAKTASTLKMAIANARIAGHALTAVIGECDERTIAERYIFNAIAEFKYQSRPKPTETRRVA